MAWNTDGSSGPAETKTLIKCNGKDYDVTGIEGLGLCEKLKAIARENQISKFDVYDEDNKNLSASDIENGNFEGNLSLVRFSVAA